MAHLNCARFILRFLQRCLYFPFTCLQLSSANCFHSHLTCFTHYVLFSTHGFEYIIRSSFLQHVLFYIVTQYNNNTIQEKLPLFKLLGLVVLPQMYVKTHYIFCAPNLRLFCYCKYNCICRNPLQSFAPQILDCFVTVNAYVETHYNFLRPRS